MTFHCKLSPVQGQYPNTSGDIHSRCVQCGKVYGPHHPNISPEPHPCTRPDSQKENVPLPSYLARASEYIQAWARHRAAGKPLAPLPIILERFKVCSACDMYNDLDGACSVCGCFINLYHRGQGMNKLEWASEHCPAPQPKWQAIVEWNEEEKMKAHTGNRQASKRQRSKISDARSDKR